MAVSHYAAPLAPGEYGPPPGAPPPGDPYASHRYPPQDPGRPPAAGFYGPPGYSPYGPPPAYGHPGYGHPPAYGAPPPHGPPGYPPPHHAYGHPPYGYPPHPHYPPPPHPGGFYGGYPRARSRSRSRGRMQAESGKFTCTFYIGIQNDDDFMVGKRIIGQGGLNMKDIVKKAGTEAKLRLRGKGSGFKEHSTDQESEEPLQLCISCCDAYGYETAIHCVDGLLRKIYSDYDRFCYDKGLPYRAPELCMRERRGPERRDRDSARARRPPPQSAPRKPEDDGDKGDPPPDAPSVEEIERLIEERNEARRDSDYKRADQIRDDLHAKSVVLNDEKGAAGSGSAVTTWRYWRRTS